MGENLVATLAPSFLIGSSSFLQVMRTTIETLQSSNLGHVRPPTAELGALEHLKKSPQTYNGSSSAFIFDWIFFILAGKKDMH